MDARALTLELLSWPSVTGTEGERAFGPRLRDRLAALPGLEVWLEDAGDGRSAVCALSRGPGSAGVVLAGHYDVVDDEGMPPVRWLDAEWLGGRGALDMKSGLAALIAALVRHAADPGRRGSVLLVACPDEEAHSAGARAAARAIRRLDVDWRLGINADVVTDPGDGTYGRAVFDGAVGKLLPCVLVRGVPVHVGESLAGISAHWLAAGVVRAIEGQPWDASVAPPVLLGGGDTKAVYDVTMPRDVLLVFNLLTHEPDARAVLAAFRAQVERSLDEAVAAWPGARGDVTIVDADVPFSDADPIALAREALTAAAGEVSGPAAVVALGSVRYRPVPGNPVMMERLRPVIEAAGARVAGHYPHPSDISVLADGGDFPWINAGPWGRDFHQIGERVHAPYAFDVLPGLLADLAATALRPHLRS